MNQTSKKRFATSLLQVIQHHQEARHSETNSMQPDFVHCISGEALWTGQYFNFIVQEEEVAAFEQESFSSQIKATDRRLLASGLCNGAVSECIGSFKRLCGRKNLDAALQFISAMLQKGQEVSPDIFYHALQACIEHKDLVTGRRLYCLILRGCLEANTFLGSHMIRMFASCGSLSEADGVFSRLPKHNLFAWSAAIAAHTRYGKVAEAFKLYMQMQILCIRPDEYIFASILKVCTKLKSLDQGQVVHLSVIEGSFEWDPGVSNALIDMYMKCGSLKDARGVFNRMQRQDAVTMTALISGYSQHGCTLEVFQIFQGMLVKGLEPDDFILSSLLKACSEGLLFVQGKLVHGLVVEQGFDRDAITGSALIDMYVKCGDVLDACKVFSAMPEAKLPLWNMLTAGFALQGEHALVSTYVEDLQRLGLKPDDLGFACLLSACSRMGLVGEGCCLFQWMQKRHGIKPTVEHFTCIADMLSRAGLLVGAEDLLRSMPAPSDDVGWSTVLSHCRTFGDAREAALFFGDPVSYLPSKSQMH